MKDYTRFHMHAVPFLSNAIHGIYTVTGGRINTIDEWNLPVTSTCDDCRQSFIGGHLINGICVSCSNKSLVINIKCSCGKIIKTIDDIFESGDCCRERLLVDLIKERNMYKEAFIQTACVAQRLKSQQ